MGHECGGYLLLLSRLHLPERQDNIAQRMREKACNLPRESVELMAEKAGRRGRNKERERCLLVVRSKVKKGGGGGGGREGMEEKELGYKELQGKPPERSRKEFPSPSLLLDL